MITVIKRPSKFTPVNNPVIWEVETDNNDLVYFDVELIDNATEEIIHSDRIYPFPTNPTLSYIDVSRFLSNTVNWQIINDASLAVSALDKPVRAYRVKVTEKILSGSTIVDGDEYNNTADINYVFDAEVDRVSFANYNQNKYLITSTSTNVKFLTTKPDYSRVNDASSEFLYFLQDGTPTTLELRVRTYNVTNSIINSYTSTITGLADNNMYRLNVSPKSLKVTFNADFTNVAYYVVDLVSSTSTVKSEAKRYVYGKKECYNEYLNLLWVNDLGGVDSYQFINPQETVSISNRFTIKRNIAGIYNGIYADSSNGIYNPSEEIINTKTTGSGSVISEPLNDLEAYWLTGLFKSKQVFMELSNNELVPIMINNTSYQIPRLKYVKGALNNISITFTLADGVLPSGIGAYGNVE